MSDEAREGNEGALAAAQKTIAEQKAEIESLRGRLAHERFAEELSEVLRLAAAAGTIAAPTTHARLLEMIVETAAQVIPAQAGALFLLDEEAEELVFEVALGQKAAEVKSFRVPLGHGIAGLVAVTGQPMAVADAQQDPRQAADIAQSVGYAPRSILCVPLFYNDGVIGVLELLDKAGGASFGARDMEVLGMFANQAAVAIEQSRTQRSLGALIGEVLGSLSELPDTRRQELESRGRAFADELQADQAHREMLELARLVQEISAQGDNERRACHTILQGFADYLRSRPSWGGDLA
jgi:GAF domain-containing protein